MPAAGHTKLTDELALRLVDALMVLPIKLACESVGVTEQSYHAWAKRADAGEEPFATFFSLAREARAKFVRDQVEAILGSRSAPGNWKAKAWYLERCLPEHFKLRTEQQTDLTSGGKPIEPVTIYLPSNDRDPAPADPGEVAL